MHSEHCPELHQAAWDSDLARLEQLLSSGEDPDTGDDWQLTPIMSMLMRHSLPDTRRVFRDRETVLRNLVMDCRQEHAERVAKSSAVLKLFFRFGANPDARSSAKKTALHYTTCDGLYEAAKHLLDAGATVDCQDENGQTPLHCAIEEESLVVINLLVSRGASIDVQDKHGESPLSMVIRKGLVVTMQILLNHHALVSTRGRLDFAGSVLLQAVTANSVEIVRLLVSDGYASVAYQNAAGETAMHLAIAQNKTEVLKILCELDSDGLSLHAVSNPGESVFHLASRVGTARDVEKLVSFWQQMDAESRSEVLDKTDGSGSTPLFVASTTTESRLEDGDELFHDRQKKMELLLVQGATLLADQAHAFGNQGHQVCLPLQARRCLNQWLAECQAEDGGKLLDEFCRKWIANVPAKASDKLTTMLHLAVCSGFSADVLPLLLMLPQTNAAELLASFDAFMTSRNGLQFRCLANELVLQANKK